MTRLFSELTAGEHSDFLTEGVRRNQRRDVLQTKLRLLHDEALDIEDAYTAVCKAVPDATLDEIERAANNIRREARWLAFLACVGILLPNLIKLTWAAAAALAVIYVAAVILFGVYP